MLTGPLPEKVDHRKLVNDQAKLEGTIPLVNFSRLVQPLKSDQGNVQVSLGFRKGRKHRIIVAGKAAVNVSLECQACLGSQDFLLEVKLLLTIVGTQSALLELPQEEDGLLVEDKLVVLVDLIEDELMLGLPMVARHADGDCDDVYRLPEPPLEPLAVTEEGTYRPFAGLLDGQEK